MSVNEMSLLAIYCVEYGVITNFYTLKRLLVGRPLDYLAMDSLKWADQRMFLLWLYSPYNCGSEHSAVQSYSS